MFTSAGNVQFNLHGTIKSSKGEAIAADLPEPGFFWRPDWSEAVAGAPDMNH